LIASASVIYTEDMKKYDTIIHLACDTALPSYLAIKQFECPRHIMAVSHDTEPAFKILQGVLDTQGVHTEKLNVPVDDLNTCRRRLNKLFSGLPEGRHAINLSGGNRIMFAAFFEIALQHKIPAFYLEPTSKTLNWLDEEAQKEPLLPVIDSVTDFVRLAGFAVDDTQQSKCFTSAMERQEAAMACWQYKQQIGIWSKSLRSQAKNPGIPFRDGPRTIKGVELSAVLKKPTDGSKGMLHIGEHAFTIKPWCDLAAFLNGNWYKDAVLANLVHLQNKGMIRDMAIDIHPAETGQSPQAPFPSIDILFTDGINLTIVKCRLNWPDNALMHKMERQVQQLCGDFGQGVLAVAYEKKNASPSSSNTRTLTTLCGAASVTHPERFLVINEPST